MTPQRDDALLDREPWVPLGLPMLKVGDRVEVRRRAECPYDGYAIHGEGDGAPDGTLGEVWMLFAAAFGGPTQDGHDIFVAFSTDAEGRTESGWFCLGELLPAPAPAETEA